MEYFKAQYSSKQETNLELAVPPAEHTRLHIVDPFQIRRQNAVVLSFYRLLPFLRRLVTNFQRVDRGSSTSQSIEL